ncbi:MAG: flagellar hook-associated protein FlgL [Deltaproteobacteria bacterium]|nr:flagellar hook-associated protein FlgL [Deltaproteobacteria bacterium]
MRISAKIMADNIKANIAKQSAQLMNTQLKLASGKRINRPSDDHIGIGKVLGYRSTLSTIDQYQENITDSQTRVKYTETILGQIHDFLREAKGIASYPGTDDKTALAEAVRDIRDQTIGLANSKYGKNYLFSGNLTDTPAFDLATYAYNGDAGSHRVMIGEGITVELEADGSQMFIDSGDNLFQVLDDLEAALTADDPVAIQAAVDPLERIGDRIQIARSGLASDYKRLEATNDYWSSFGNAVETMRSGVEDADITQTALDMQVQQTSYEVLLATAAQVIQPTLVDFLR